MFKALKPNMNTFVLLVFGIMLFPPIEQAPVSSKFSFFLFSPSKSQLDLDVIIFEIIIAFAVSIIVHKTIIWLKKRKESSINLDYK